MTAVVDDSGLVQPRIAKFADICIMMENLDFSLGDLLLGGVPTIDTKECCAICRAEPGECNWYFQKKIVINLSVTVACVCRLQGLDSDL